MTGTKENPSQPAVAVGRWSLHRLYSALRGPRATCNRSPVPIPFNVAPVHPSSASVPRGTPAFECRPPIRRPRTVAQASPALSAWMACTHSA